MEMWLQCLKLLQNIRDQAMRVAPREYPVSEYGYGLGPIMMVSSLLQETVEPCFPRLL